MNWWWKLAITAVVISNLCSVIVLTHHVREGDPKPRIAQVVPCDTMAASTYHVEVVGKPPKDGPITVTCTIGAGR